MLINFCVLLISFTSLKLSSARPNIPPFLAQYDNFRDLNSRYDSPRSSSYSLQIPPNTLELANDQPLDLNLNEDSLTYSKRGNPNSNFMQGSILLGENLHEIFIGKQPLRTRRHSNHRNRYWNIDHSRQLLNAHGK